MRSRRDRKSSEPFSEVVLSKDTYGSIALDLRRGTYFQLDPFATAIVEQVQVSGWRNAALELSIAQGRPLEEVKIALQQVIETIEQTHTRRSATPRTPSVQGLRSLVRQWTSLPPRLKVSTVKMGILVIWVEVLILLVPIDTAATWLGASLNTDPPAELLPEMEVTLLDRRERRSLWALDWVHRSWIYDATCLRRALAHAWILRRRSPFLAIGLAGSGAIPHAYLVVDGRTLGGLDELRNLRLTRRATEESLRRA